MSDEYSEKKYISCKGCGCELESDWRKCPYCKTVNLSAPRKFPTKAVLIVLFSVIAVVAVFAVFIIKSSSANPLFSYKVEVYTVMNGSSTAAIGERALIEIPKHKVDELTAEQFNDFLETKVKGSGYNWFTIDFGDGTGIVFAGCDIEIPTYCRLSDEGMQGTALGYITRRNIDGVVSFDYEPAA